MKYATINVVPSDTLDFLMFWNGFTNVSSSIVCLYVSIIVLELC